MTYLPLLWPTREATDGSGPDQFAVLFQGEPVGEVRKVATTLGSRPPTPRWVCADNEQSPVGYQRGYPSFDHAVKRLLAEVLE